MSRGIVQVQEIWTDTNGLHWNFPWKRSASLETVEAGASRLCARYAGFPEALAPSGLPLHLGATL